MPKVIVTLTTDDAEEVAERLRDSLIRDEHPWIPGAHLIEVSLITVEVANE